MNYFNYGVSVVEGEWEVDGILLLGLLLLLREMLDVGLNKEVDLYYFIGETNFCTGMLLFELFLLLKLFVVLIGILRGSFGIILLLLLLTVLFIVKLTFEPDILLIEFMLLLLFIPTLLLLIFVMFPGPIILFFIIYCPVADNFMF